MSKPKLAFLYLFISMFFVSAITFGAPEEVNSNNKNLETGEISSTISGKCGQDYKLVTPKNAETWVVNITVQSEWSNQSIHIRVYEAIGEYPYNYESQTDMPKSSGKGEASLLTYLNTSKNYEVWIRDGYARAFTGEIKESWGQQTIEPSDISKYPESNWTTFHGDLANTGFVENEVNPPLTLIWKKWMNSGEAHPVIVNGTIYVGSHSDSILYAFDSETGTTLWNYDLSIDDGLRRPIKSAVAVSNNIVVVNSWDNVVFALNAKTGSLVWKYISEHPIFDTDHSGFFIHPSPVIVNEVVYIGLGDGYMHAISLITGQQIWELQTEAVFKSTPAYDEGVLFFGNGQNRGPYDPYFYAVNATNGNIVWKFNKGGTRVVSSPAVKDGLVFFAANSRFYALNTKDGSIRWQFDVSSRSSIHSSPAVSDDTVYFTDSDCSYVIPKGNLYALDLLTGEEKWVKEGYFGYISPILTGDVLYLGELHTPEEKSSIYAINASNGKTLWSYLTDGVVDSIPAPYGNRLYISPVDGYLYAFEEAKLIADNVSLSSSRCEVDTEQTISVHFSWDYNGEDASNLQIGYNQNEYLTDAEGWLKIRAKQSEVGVFTVWLDELSCNHDIEMQVENPSISFDKVIITIPETQHTDIGEDFSWSGVYALDSYPFPGSLILNNTELPLQMPRKVHVSVLGIIDPQYGVSSFEADSFEVIYDSVKFNISIQDTRINVGDVPRLSVTGVYLFDSTSFQGHIEVSDPLNDVGVSDICIVKITDSKYGLNSFSSNIVECIWDTIQIVEGGASESSVNTGDEVSVWFDAEYAYDSEPFTEEDGKLFINGEEATWDSSSNHWILSVSSDEPAKISYSVTGITDSQYGLTVYQSETDEVEVEWKITGIPGFSFYAIMLGFLLVSYTRLLRQKQV